MSDILQSQLRKTLAGTHTVERELPGGGLSRLFLGTELRFQRQVVIKVLPPNFIAGVSVERFEREIAVAANLQHANIVPVLTAGQTAGLPFFTMPFVDGESLRARLNRGPIPVEKPVRFSSTSPALSHAPIRTESSTAISSPRTSCCRAGPRQ